MSDQQPPPPPEEPQQPYGQQPPPGAQQPPPGYGQQPPPGYGQQPQYGGQQPYQPYPEDGARREYEAYAASTTMERPPSINTAVLLMRIGAALSALYLIITLAMLGSLKDDIRDELDRSGDSYTQSDIDTAYTIVITSVVIFGVIGVVLWLWMAAKNRKGRNWARITATVLGALNILLSLLSLTGGTDSNPSAVGTFFTIANLVVAAVALFFMYRKDASAYYAAMSRRR
jgi:hypothetical protein